MMSSLNTDRAVLIIRYTRQSALQVRKGQQRSKMNKEEPTSKKIKEVKLFLNKIIEEK